VEKHIQLKTETVWLRYAGVTATTATHRAMADLDAKHRMWPNIMSLVQNKMVEIWRLNSGCKCCTVIVLTIQFTC
jgi:G3E family GTPase